MKNDTPLEKRHPLYEGFVRHVRLRSKTAVKPQTVRNILQQLESMRNEHELDLETPDVEEVFASMERAGVSAATMNSRRSILRRWLEYRNIAITADMKALFNHKNGDRKRLIHPNDLLTVDELEDIVAHTNSPALRALYWCLYDTGARPGSICGLNISDMQSDQNGYVFTFRSAKTEESKRPVRLLDPRAHRQLEMWLASHPDRDSPDAPLFVNRLGNRYSPIALSSILKMRHQDRLGRGQGKSKSPLNLYLFRKSRATALLKGKRLSEMEVKARLGHSKTSNMMEQYYAILDEKDQAEAELRAMGIVTEGNGQELQPVSCPNCGALNAPDAKRCVRCRLSMTEEASIEDDRRMFETVFSDPERLKLFASMVAEQIVKERENVNKKSKRRREDKADAPE